MSALARSLRQCLAPGPGRLRCRQVGPLCLEVRLRLSEFGAPDLEPVASRRQLGQLRLLASDGPLGAQALEVDLSVVQSGQIVLELAPILRETLDFLLQARQLFGRLAVSASGLAAPVDQLAQSLIEGRDQRCASIAAQHLAHLGIESGLQRSVRARRDLR